MTNEPDYTPEGGTGEPIVGDAPPTATTLFSNKAYDQLKWVALVLLPALAVLYMGLAPLWDLPKQEAVSGTIILVDTFLGVLLGLSTKQYNTSGAAFDGHVSLSADEVNGTTDAAFSIDPNALAGKKQIRLKVHEH